MATFSDTVATFQTRLSAAAPHLALNPQTLLMNLSSAHLSAIADVDADRAANVPNMFAAQASGPALYAIGTNYGVTPLPGTAATAYVVFTLQQPATVAQTIATPTVVSTTGNGTTSLAQAFTTTANATIPIGSTSSGAPQGETVTITGSPTGGTFTLTHTDNATRPGTVAGAQATGAIAYNATAAAVQAALVALSNVGAGNVAVTGSAGGPYAVAWTGALQGYIFPVMTATGSLTGGTSPAVTSGITTPMAGTAATANVPGSAGDVGAGAITVANLPAGTTAVDVTNPLAATGGTDGESDAAYFARLQAVLQAPGGDALIQLRAQAVPGVYDAYVSDPASGNTITIYWGDSAGATSNAATLAAVQLAVASVLPADVLAAYSGFSVTQLTLSATYSSPLPATQIEPLIQAAMANYVQLTIKHGQRIDASMMFQSVQQAIGYALTAFTATITPSGALNPTQTITTLYRFSAAPSTISLTRQ